MKTKIFVVAVLACVFLTHNLLAGRPYDARIARFTQPDPALRNGTPQFQMETYGPELFSQSPYNYGFNNPLKYVDPDGNFPIPFAYYAIAAGVTYLATNFSGDHPGGSPGLVQSTMTLGAIAAFPAAAEWSLANPVTATAISTSVAEGMLPGGESLSPTGMMTKAVGEMGEAAMKASKVTDIAEKIGSGHAFEKHLGQFEGITDKKGLSGLVQSIIDKPSSSKDLARGRKAYWDKKSGTVVIYDPKHKDSGTIFKPENGQEYFDNLE